MDWFWLTWNYRFLDGGGGEGFWSKEEEGLVL